MTRRFVRIALVCLGVLPTGGLGYRVWLDEQALNASRTHSLALDQSADEAQTALASARAALNASVAAGQDAPGWIARADTQFDALRRALITIDAAAASGGAVADALDSLDQLAAAEKRVHADVDSGEPLLAADVIFTEMPPLLDAIGRQTATARQVARREWATREASLRRQQAAEAGAAVALWTVVAMLLLPTPKALAATSAEVAAPTLDGGLDLSLAPGRPQLAPAETRGDSAGAPVLEQAPDASHVALAAIAEVCTDLSSLSDQEALASALARACDLLGATGAIVWIAAQDGRSLLPALAHGYDPTVIGRIGAITTDGANLTAAAFREGGARVTPAASGTPAALVVPMIGPAGPVGVLSAELRVEHPALDDLIALGTIFAAQLATLALPAPAALAEQQNMRRQAQA